jgi:hypothetical protein
MSQELFEVFDRVALAALQARDLPRVRASDYFTKKDDTDPQADDELARWDAYLAGFAKLEGGRCLCCGDRLGGHLLDKALGLVGGVEWGLAHGEGHCSKCGYPMRGYHCVEGLGKISNLFLAYHPSTLSFSAPAEEAP